MPTICSVILRGLLSLIKVASVPPPTIEEANYSVFVLWCWHTLSDHECVFVYDVSGFCLSPNILFISSFSKGPLHCEWLPIALNSV